MSLNGVCGIYRITNIHNGHFYIGSSYNIGKRIIQHRVDLNKNRHHSPYLQRSWNIYGEMGFEFSLVESCSRDDLLLLEQHYLDSLNPEYNVSKSAISPMTGRTHSPETKEKIKSKLSKLFTKDQMIERAKHANTFAQLPNARKKHKESVDKSFTPERIKRMKDSQSSLWKTEEHRVKMSEAHKHYTDEIRARLSEAQRTLWKDEEYREKASKSRRGKGRALHTPEDVIEIRKAHFELGMSAREISEKTGSPYRTIRSILYDNWKWLK